MRVGLLPSEAGFAALNALLEGLEQTGRRGTWGFGGWPMEELTPKVTGTRLFSGRNTTSFAVEVLLLNDKQKQVGKGSVTLSAAPGFAGGNKSVTLPVERFDSIRFQNVKADELSPVLTIVINSVNNPHQRWGLEWRPLKGALKPSCFSCFLPVHKTSFESFPSVVL
ncbi:MAG: hypothetical protein LBD18_04460, partial [Treponema sp.]|nr:hypothetical protein [Treponema sp.]